MESLLFGAAPPPLGLRIAANCWSQARGRDESVDTARLLALVRLAWRCRRSGAPFLAVLEPEDSAALAALAPDLLAAARSSLIVLDLCGFGGRHCRRLALLASFDVSNLARRCRGRGRLCGATMRPHLPFEGRDATGCCWSTRARAVPAAFWRALVAHFAAALCPTAAPVTDPRLTSTNLGTWGSGHGSSREQQVSTRLAARRRRGPAGQNPDGAVQIAGKTAARERVYVLFPSFSLGIHSIVQHPIL